jgi:putative ABC transport system permease protein
VKLNLTTRLALTQLKIKRARTVMTLLGISLSTATITAVYGYGESARTAIYKAIGRDLGYPAVILALGLILGGIVIAASVIVISNSFRVSAGERMRQFGLLKSVGATKKQISRIILAEGIFLSVIGIPAGLLIGLLVELLGLTVVSAAFRTLRAGNVLTVDVALPFVVTPWMFVVAIITSLATVLLAAWLPARQAAKMPAIDAIRQKSEVKATAKSVRVSKLTRLLFGFEGALAAKSMKRSRRNYRATVVSLTVSIVLFIAASSFGAQIKATTSVVWQNVDATAAGQYYSHSEPIDPQTVRAVTQKLRAYPGAAIFGVGARLENNTVSYITADDEHYAELCAAAGAPPGANILVNYRQEKIGGKYKTSVPHTLAAAREKYPAIRLDGELKGAKIPEEIKLFATEDLCLLVPESAANNYYWFANVQDSAAFRDYCEKVLQAQIPAPEGGEIWLHSFDLSGESKNVNTIVNTIMFFVYGFVGMLTLIALTNVISTVSANMRSRFREFAVLTSVGMTRDGIRKMLNLESVLCSAKSLVLGLPLGVAAAYAVYKGLGLSVEFPFELPWRALLASIAGVFAVTWATMRGAANRWKNGGIDAIRETSVK